LTTIEKYRSLYEKIKSTHYNDPHTQDSGPDDPLSQDEDVSFSLFNIFKTIFYRGITSAYNNMLNLNSHVGA
jgi:hypothetical protein